MKRILLIITLVLTCTLSFAQEKETAEPTFGVTVEREVQYASINGKLYEDVSVT